MAFFEAVKASGPLDRHRILSKTAGVRVSPLCLGAMSLGKTWSSLLSGGIDEAQSFELLDYFYKNGGNFIDTAGNYQDDESEMIIGEWMKSRGNREDIVLATKFTSTHKFKGKDGVEIPVNYGGNHKKSLRNCLASSLKKMQTEYVDILYLHWWDWSTSIEELMQSLHQVVQSGKVLYLGISDTPAWIVSSANAYARAHSLTPFSIYQGKWNVLERDFDRDILPMCRHEGMAIAPWSVLCAGRLRTEEQIAERIKERGPLRGDKQSEAEAQMSKTLDDMGKKELNGASIAQIAIAYVFAKYPYTFPIIGGTKVSHIEDNIKAIQIKLTDEQIKRIEDSAPFDLGFPMNMIKEEPQLTGKTQGTFLLGSSGEIDWARVERGPNNA